MPRARRHTDPDTGRHYALARAMAAQTCDCPPCGEGPGACCLPNAGDCSAGSTSTCADLTQSACSMAGGIWRGPGTNCGTENCEAAALRGACCLVGRPCGNSITAHQCACIGGGFAGPGTVCGPQACDCCTYSVPTPVCKATASTPTTLMFDIAVRTQIAACCSDGSPSLHTGSGNLAGSVQGGPNSPNICSVDPVLANPFTTITILTPEVQCWPGPTSTQSMSMNIQARIPDASGVPSVQVTASGITAASAQPFANPYPLPLGCGGGTVMIFARDEFTLFCGATGYIEYEGTIVVMAPGVACAGTLAIATPGEIAAFGGRSFAQVNGSRVLGPVRAATGGCAGCLDDPERTGGAMI